MDRLWHGTWQKYDSEIWIVHGTTRGGNPMTRSRPSMARHVAEIQCQIWVVHAIARSRNLTARSRIIHGVHVVEI